VNQGIHTKERRVVFKLALELESVALYMLYPTVGAKN